jgi:tRNA A-37 threonylcarbamoyl transferase component Bud32
MATDPVAAAIEGIAEGASIDWGALDANARTNDERDLLKYLRVVAGIADLHRSSGSPSNNVRSELAPSEDHPTRLLSDSSETFGRYRLEEKIGQGSFGSVYRAWDPVLQREVALKILHRRVDDAGLKDRLQKEGQALASIAHENVVRVFDLESEGDQVALCMEFVAGETFESVLRTHGLLSDREAALVGEDVCRALAAVHKAGFIHRDVNARNVMRQRSGRTVLMDFGTGFRLKPGVERQPYDVVGTPIYMAPEVLTGQAPSACSDVYSVGVFLYHLVTGEYPVTGKSVPDLMAAHATGRRRPLSDLRPDLMTPFTQVVSDALAADPDARPSAGALLEALGRLKDKPVPPPVRTKTRVLLALLLGVPGIVLALTALGIVNSVPFNSMLGRTDFANEGFWEWLQWGAKSILAPMVLLLMGLVALALINAGRQLLHTASARERAIEASAVDVMRRVRLSDVTTMASCALLFSTSLLSAVVWIFSPLIGATIDDINLNISTMPGENLQYFSPYFQGYHENYRICFTWVSIACVAVWLPVLKAAKRKGEPVNRALLAGGTAVVILSLLFLDFPYRLFAQSEFEAATCGDDHLLFCPESSSPRNRIVKQNAPDLEHVGAIEKIFTRVAITDKDWPCNDRLSRWLFCSPLSLLPLR